MGRGGGGGGRSTSDWNPNDPSPLDFIQHPEREDLFLGDKTVRVAIT